MAVPVEGRKHNFFQAICAATGRQRSRDNLDSQNLFEGGCVDFDTQPFGLIHEVTDQDDRLAGLDQLQGHRQHALQVLGVDYVQGNYWSFLEQDIPGDPLLFRHGNQPVHPRRIDHADRLARQAAFSPADFYRRTRVIGDRDLSSGQGVEQHALAYVGRPDDRDQRQPAGIYVGTPVTTGAVGFWEDPGVRNGFLHG